MAVFGAPAALEDHAIRACMAALDIQKETSHLAAEIENRDSVTLQLRIGLNSGQVIAGETGSGTFGYTAIGEQVGDGPADGIGRTARSSNAQRVHRATG